MDEDPHPGGAGGGAQVNAARGFAKAMGERLPACDGLRETLKPLLEQVSGNRTPAAGERSRNLDRFRKVLKIPLDGVTQMTPLLSSDKSRLRMWP